MRTSGRTFRALLKALLECSSGKYVILNGRTDQNAKYLFDTLTNMLNTYMTDKGYLQDSSKKTIKLGAGTIVVITDGVHSLDSNISNSDIVDITDYLN